MTHGDICLVDFGIPFGSESGYKRPVVIVQSDKDNLNNLNTTVVIPQTRKRGRSNVKHNSQKNQKNLLIFLIFLL